MSDLREIIDKEFSDFSFTYDINEFKKKYKKGRRNIRCIAVSVISVCVVFTTVAVFYGGKNQTDNIISGDENSSTIIIDNTFYITAYAAEGPEKNSTFDTAEKEYELFGDDSIIIPEFRILVDEIEQPEKTYKTFRLQGSAAIGVKGENIKNLKFHSEISAFWDKESLSYKNDMVLNYDSFSPENNTLNWGIPEEFNYWAEKQNEPDYVFEFSDLPTDTVTITVSFKDGTTQTKSVDLYFNDAGYLVIQTENSLYNNGTDTENRLR